ncbi:MAG TPA: sugar phosphate nucleotidyltransferase [Micromonosporaceae bacterium]|nr:sugar phosphate nucleotidyltransferase [Micromonosporaceae bacterium]
MARPKTLLLVLAGGAGGRMELLTEHRAKPAMPYGGSYRLIDVPLSNAHHAGIADVWVIEQYHPTSIQDHLANGRPWDLDRTTGGLMTLHPHLGSDREGWHQGTADALWRQAPLIREFGAETVMVVSADAVYQLDYAEVAAAHLASGALVTMVTTRRPIDEASRYGVVVTDPDGRITEYAYKPDEPATDVVTTEVFAFEPDALLDTLQRLADDGGEDGLRDLGHGLLPELVQRGGAREYRQPGYWRDVGTIAAYHESHLELVQPEPPIVLDDPGWPILTANAARGGVRVDAGAQVGEALLGAGCRVAGTVRRSVLSGGVVVEAGAEVLDSVLLSGVTVREGAVVRGAVVDINAIIEKGAKVGVGEPGKDADDRIAVIGAGVRVGADAQVPPGARVDR